MKNHDYYYRILEKIVEQENESLQPYLTYAIYEGRTEFILEAMEEVDRNKWISVIDQLPPLNTPVLACCVTDNGTTSAVVTSCSTYSWNSKDSIMMEDPCDDELDFYPCTHWMYFEEPRIDGR